MTKRVVSVGECMVEVAALGAVPGQARLGFGGDTLNTAVYLARQGIAVAYATALGDDPYSEAMIRSWEQEGIDTSLVARCAGRLPGLYLIRTDDRGERSFAYWRDRAPARQLFALPEAARVAEAIAGFDVIYFSGIALSLYDDAGRETFLARLREARSHGAWVVFDGNYRPRGWPDPATARAAFARFLSLATHALPTFDDEQALFGDADPAATLARLRGYGVGEIVLKRGADGARVQIGDMAAIAVPVPEAVRPVDTTAAGDSFNAGYLAARLGGADPVAAARQGHRLAAIVIAHRGAIVPASVTAPLFDLSTRLP